jgi:general stress protein 26
MFRKVTVIMSLVLAVALSAGPASALSVPGMKHHVTGNVTSVDPASNSLTVVDDKSQKSFTFTAKDPAMLNGIRNGEHVRVAYSKHGSELIASKVAAKTTSSRSASRNK